MTTSPDTRQQRRLRKRTEHKAEQRKPLSEKAKRLSFKAAKQHFAEIRKATEAQFHLGPVAVQMAMMVILSSLGAYRSRGKGRGTAARRYGNTSGHTPHQGVRECLRRRIGGFAAQRRAEHYFAQYALDVEKHSAPAGTYTEEAFA